MEHPIYLDHNATTPLLPEVVEAMLPYLREHFGNPSSAHVFGQRARQAVNVAREQVAALLDCDPGEVTFTSGGTEANNLAIRARAIDHTRRHSAGRRRPGASQDDNRCGTDFAHCLTGVRDDVGGSVGHPLAARYGVP